ncbi:MAG TPA: hypothetical protein VL728_09120 [Cyclobacteriaceae bacterium]|nr:hypothetical protein [Cyclobacteriaceae bacterium]
MVRVKNRGVDFGSNGFYAGRQLRRSYNNFLKVRVPKIIIDTIRSYDSELKFDRLALKGSVDVGGPCKRK